MRRITGSFVLFAACVTGLCATPARAQLAVYGSFSASDFKLPHVGWQYGTTFGAYYDRWSIPFFAYGLDARGTVVGSGNTHIYSGLVGPQIRFKPHILPFMPYVEAVVGAGNVQTGQGSTQNDITKFEYQFLGGVDWTILPRIDWRVAEFSYGSFSGLGRSSLNPNTLSTGIVFRLP